MLYLPIKETWIVSRSARRVYLVCALAALSFFGTLLASAAALRTSRAVTPEAFAAAAFIIRLFLWPGIAGTALLSIAMWYFWFDFDDSGWLKKALWSLPLYLLLPIGPALYYFLVYCRSAKVSNCK